MIIIAILEFCFLYAIYKADKERKEENEREWRSYWECECLRCGKTVILRKDAFAYPYSRQKSCGCWHPEESSIRAKNSQNKITGKFEKMTV